MHSVCLYTWVSEGLISYFIPFRQGKEQIKPETSALYIQNPFEITLNISKNVNATQLERFVGLCRESAWLLQQGEVLNRSSKQSADSASAWGFAALLLPSVTSGAGVKSRRKRKLEPASSRIKNLLDSLKIKGGENAAKKGSANHRRWYAWTMFLGEQDILKEMAMKNLFLHYCVTSITYTWSNVKTLFFP